MTHIVQIVPYIHNGSGVAGVAWNLDREFRELGVRTERFTHSDTNPRSLRLTVRGRVTQALALTWDMLWFFTVGTQRARRFLMDRPDAVSICHNNIMTGDIYVNHGIVAAAMQARGWGVWRVLRNPTHIFTTLRDSIRYRSHTHRAIVVLSESEAKTMRRVYGRVKPRVAIIPNGVDLDRFHPPTAEERLRAREALRLDDEDRVALFIGHEFRRKGLEHAINALTFAPTVLLLVVGGQTDTLAAARAQAETSGVADRVLFVGVRNDLEMMFAASDMFVLPSAYEANALVILEALASGLPVVVTPVGYAAELVADGINGFVIDADPRQIGDRFEELAAADPVPWRSRARASVEHLSWRAIAEKYLALVHEIEQERGIS